MDNKLSNMLDKVEYFNDSEALFFNKDETISVVKFNGTLWYQGEKLKYTIQRNFDNYYRYILQCKDGLIACAIYDNTIVPEADLVKALRIVGIITGKEHKKQDIPILLSETNYSPIVIQLDEDYAILVTCIKQEYVHHKMLGIMESLKFYNSKLPQIKTKTTKSGIDIIGVKYG